MVLHARARWVQGAKHAAQVIADVRKQGLGTFEPTLEAEQAWCKRIYE